MSETVHFRGKLKKIEVEDLDAFKKEAVDNYFKTAPTPNWYEGDYEDFFDDDFCEKYIVDKGSVYEILSKEVTDADGDIYIANANSEGTIDYEVRYYNGGCGFSEAIEDALERMEKKVGNEN